MKQIGLLLISAFILTTIGCKKTWLDVNHNVDAPDHVEGYLYLANIVQQYQGVYWDVRAMGPLTQMMGTTGYGQFALNYYYLGSDAGAEIWRMTYWNQGMNLENMINQSIENEDWTLAGIGLAIKSFSWDLLTKMHGDIPVSQAYEPDRLSFDYDYQDVAYDSVRSWAHQAINYLEMPDDHEYGDLISSNDFIYHGDKDKWKRFAYGVIVNNLSSLSQKSNFKTDYAQELIDAANKSLQTVDDNATVSVAGGSQSAPFGEYNNFWGTARGNLSWTYFQHEYAVQVFTGSVPYYDEATGDRVSQGSNEVYPNRLADNQIITDTSVHSPGHYDPRVAVKLGTTSNPEYHTLDNADTIKSYEYYGGGFTGQTGSIGTAPSFYGRESVSQYNSTINDGIGRWLYRDDAPYILMTSSEIQFALAEAYWIMGDKGNALSAFKKGVAQDIEFTQKYITPGKEGSATGGDKITPGLFQSLAEEYLAGPFVGQMTESDLTLSHIMMQKWVALYPWGALEAWTDMRKYHYDINYTGDYPSSGNGWTNSQIDQKWDTDPTKVYKGFYLLPAQVQGRKSAFNVNNEGAPEYRVRPRYNSEYMWNLPGLEALKPISGTAPNYHTSIPWFAYPNGYPNN